MASRETTTIKVEQTHVLDLIHQIRAGATVAALETLQTISDRAGDTLFAEWVAKGKAKVARAVATFEGTPVIDGVIKGAVIYPYDADGSRICTGAIHGDRKQRFRDGETVTTSKIISGPDERGIIHTRNSVYRVELAA